ncbi:GNAT family N-acetyltransferase [Paraglaciecola sp. 20A4]|uniref:GNAT family N-acetyltransferase n=1 Tax=Paraglaciecola sp. 20A4 TaxID=2687288 RepID=UPI00140C40ED|nr:GNAT family N-acetyltransferase [Paraglaciecola sp. 20A4]
MELSPVEIFGYCASAVIAYSLTRSSIVRLRWFNLAGASSFCLYGIIIQAYPVAILNGFVTLTNLFFLRRLLFDVERNFSVLAVSRPSNYVDFFLEYHQHEIKHLFPRFMKVSADTTREYFFLTERTEVVGMLSGYPQPNGDFLVDFDFVIPAYRDCHLGQYVLGKGQQLSKQFGFQNIIALADSYEHENYLHRIGFSPKKNGRWTFDGE